MNGKIAKIDSNDITKKDGTPTTLYKVSFVGDSTVYETWDTKGAKVGDEVEGTTGTREWQDKTFHTIKISKVLPPKSDFPPSSASEPGGKNNSFAASYAKDIAVACIAQGIIGNSKDIEAVVNHFFTVFTDLLNRSYDL
jgi:hypothetical protein